MENVAKCQKPNITGGLERWKANEMSHVCFIDVYNLHQIVTEVGEQNIQNIHPPGFCDVIDVLFFLSYYRHRFVFHALGHEKEVGIHVMMELLGEGGSAANSINTI